MRSQIDWDALAAAFFAPIMLMYALTGAAHLLGSAVTTKSTAFSTQFENGWQMDNERLRSWLQTELNQRGHPIPSGPLQVGAELIRLGHLSRLHADVRIAKDNLALITIFEPTFYGRAALLHQGKGGRIVSVFTWLAIVYLAGRSLLAAITAWRRGSMRIASGAASALGLGLLLAVFAFAV